MYGTPGTPTRTRTPSGGTAETLILIALILQAIFTLAVAAEFLFLGSFLFFAFGPFAAIAVVFGALVLLFGLFFLYAGFEWSYRRTKSGDYDGARTWTIILGILGIFFGGIIVGILYIIGYVKLGDASNEQRQAAAPGWAPAPMPSAAPLTPAPGVAPPSPVAPTCPKCGQPGTWVAQYSRYYCYKDQQYL
ncbi:MAG TPA: hypothetical protein VGV89_05775 [Thermoplasmata archaeon]|nr:hypothetical protein [Thermoplasmata archaeon]